MIVIVIEIASERYSLWAFVVPRSSLSTQMMSDLAKLLVCYLWCVLLMQLNNIDDNAAFCLCIYKV